MLGVESGRIKAGGNWGIEGKRGMERKITSFHVLLGKGAGAAAAAVAAAHQPHVSLTYCISIMLILLPIIKKLPFFG